MAGGWSLSGHYVCFVCRGKMRWLGSVWRSHPSRTGAPRYCLVTCVSPSCPQRPGKWLVKACTRFALQGYNLLFYLQSSLFISEGLNIHSVLLFLSFLWLSLFLSPTTDEVQKYSHYSAPTPSLHNWSFFWVYTHFTQLLPSLTPGCRLWFLRLQLVCCSIFTGRITTGFGGVSLCAPLVLAFQVLQHSTHTVHLQK